MLSLSPTDIRFICVMPFQLVLLYSGVPASKDALKSSIVPRIHQSFLNGREKKELVLRQKYIHITWEVFVFIIVCLEIAVLSSDTPNNNNNNKRFYVLEVTTHCYVFVALIC